MSIATASMLHSWSAVKFQVAVQTGLSAFVDDVLDAAALGVAHVRDVVLTPPG